VLLPCNGGQVIRVEELNVNKAGQARDKKDKDNKENRFNPAAIIDYMHTSFKLMASPF